MGNKSIKIKTTPGSGDKYLKVKLEQDVDQFEILSLKISQKDLYGSFNADFGMLIGRVIANGGVGIPNAKISIFIPITDEDKLNSDILSIYPYTSPRDKNLDGVRYNLLPRVSVNNPYIVSGDYAPKVPVGTFPTKEEITTNETYIEVYEKYYKFTTVTNASGDYMIYGVPVGNQTVHMSVDITDIGKYSMNPSTLIKNLGYSPNLFTDNGTRIKFSTDLDTLPNVETQEIAVEVRPFWGDTNNFEIGITRQDFKIRAVLLSSFVVFGGGFTDAQTGAWGSGDSSGDREWLYHMSGDDNTTVSISSKRIGTVNETIYYIPNTISDSDVTSGNYDPSQYRILDKTEYTQFIENGQFCYVIPCNRRKIVTDANGNEVVVDNNNPNGVFTEFIGFFEIDYSNLKELPIDGSGDLDGKSPNENRMRLKIPQSASFGNTFNNTDDANTTIWRKQNYKFTGGEFFSVAKFNGLYSGKGGTLEPNQLARDPFFNVGVIIVDDAGDFPDTNSSFEYPSNGGTDVGSLAFGAEWMNFSVYHPQMTNYGGRGGDKVNLGLTINPDGFSYIRDNTQLIAEKVVNTIYMGRSDIHQTDFIPVPKEDILNIISHTIDGTSKKGFRSIDFPYFGDPLIGTGYKSTGSVKYFYKGLSSTNDCIMFLRRLSLI